MKDVTFDDLVHSPPIRHFETAFRNATGVSLKVILVDEGGKRPGTGRNPSAFCAMLGISPEACVGCLHGERHSRTHADQKPGPQKITCLGGLTHLSVPVVVWGQHVATLLSGQVFCRRRTEREFELAIEKVKDRRQNHWEMKARRAYFETPVVTVERFQAVAHLLNVFAQYLAEDAGRRKLCGGAKEPRMVSGAKQFVQSRLQETVTLGLVAQHVHVSRFYFCKVFKKATGMTLTEYVGRVRVEKAKTLLANSSIRVSEAAYAAGFGSIPRFNSVFKRYVGMSPTEHRTALRSPLPA